MRRTAGEPANDPPAADVPSHQRGSGPAESVSDHESSARMNAMRAIIAQVEGSRMRAWLPAAAVVAAIVVALPAAQLLGSKLGLTLPFGFLALALALGPCLLISPAFATIVLLVTLFLGLALQSQNPFPIDLFLIVFAALVIAAALWMDRTPTRLRGIGAIEWAMALYLMWNVYSMFAPHKYTAGPQLPNDQGIISDLSIPRFIVIGTLIPFAMYVVGRYTFDRAAAVSGVLWTLLTLAAYSAAMSIMQFKGPTGWVWPRYIVDEPSWDGRAVGVFNQPVINGMVLALGIAVAMLLASQRSEPAWRRCVAAVVAIACGYGLYFTHTRAAWLSGAVVLIIGAILAKGFRKGFITALCLVVTVIVTNWSVFASADREAGGVASVGEVHDRLNNLQTALWAAAEKPVAGWGIGRFPAVNTYHHQQWSLDIPWIRGYGFASHEYELGLLAELGVIGLALWICVLALIAYRLWDAYRTLPGDELCGKPLAVTAIMAVAILVCAGLTVDLRFFDFPMVAVFLLAGIAIGCSDRYKRAQADAGGDFAEPALPRHA
jgi:O-antigen ligase